MADSRENYAATSAPLVVENLVVSGIAGGDGGVRGFLAAFDQKTGKEAWQFWTIPAKGEAGAETWNGKALAHPGGATWFTGSYDPGLKTLYWQVGNPGPDHNGDEREGDNLYSDSVVALDPTTGRAEVALPVHSSRRMGLGCSRTAHLGRREMEWARPQVAAARQSEWLLLRSGPQGWEVPSRETLCPEADVGQGNQYERQAGAQS